MKNNLLFLVIGFLLVIVCTVIINGYLLIDDSYKPTKVNPVVIQTKVESGEVKYQQALDSLTKGSQKLALELKSSKLLLEKSKKKNLVLQTQVYDLIDQNISIAWSDTAMRLSNCDSVKSKVEELITESNNKDSLYEVVNSNLEDQLKNKDSTIAVSDKKYINLKTAFDQSIEQGQLLVKENKQLSKSIRKQKVKSKLLSATLFVLTGVAANYLIQH